MNTTDLDWINKAVTLSKESPYPRINIGCIITDSRSRIQIGSGFNLPKTHPIQFRFNTKSGNIKPHVKMPCLHAELSALVSAVKDSGEESLVGSVAYVGRLDRNGNLGMCKPCPACDMALKQYGVKRVVYTSPKGIKQYENYE